MKSKPPKNALRVDVYLYRESITYNLGDLDHRKDGRLDDLHWMIHTKYSIKLYGKVWSSDLGLPAHFPSGRCH